MRASGAGPFSPGTQLPDPFCTFRVLSTNVGPLGSLDLLLEAQSSILGKTVITHRHRSPETVYEVSVSTAKLIMESSREARRRRILERGSDRLALITGRIQTLPSPSSSPASSPRPSDQDPRYPLPSPSSGTSFSSLYFPCKLFPEKKMIDCWCLRPDLILLLPTGCLEWP